MPRNLEKVQKYHQPAKWAIIFRANLFILLLQVCYIFGSPPDLYLRTLSVSTLLLFSQLLQTIKNRVLWKNWHFLAPAMFFQWISKTAYRLKTISVANKIKHCQQKTLSVVHFSAFVRQHYSSIWSLPGKIDFLGQLSFKTTRKMWHFSYLKQKNHRSCQLGLRK
jgi:hypothetical protein